MNEDITQEIYICLIEAGFNEERAQILCGDPYLKDLLEDYKQDALRQAKSKFTDFLEMVIDSENYVRNKK